MSKHEAALHASVYIINYFYITAHKNTQGSSSQVEDANKREQELTARNKTLLEDISAQETEKRRLHSLLDGIREECTRLQRQLDENNRAACAALADHTFEVDGLRARNGDLAGRIGRCVPFSCVFSETICWRLIAKNCV